MSEHGTGAHPPREQVDPRDARLVAPAQCCQVKQTIQLGPSIQVPPGNARWGALFEGRTPLETQLNRQECERGLLSISFLSFVTSSGDFTAPLRAIELFLIQHAADPTDRQDVWSIPLFKGTVALLFEQYEGGFAVPLDFSGPARTEFRLRVGAGANEPWACAVGLMLTLWNEF